jgi:hypothetical protein
MRHILERTEVSLNVIEYVVYRAGHGAVDGFVAICRVIRWRSVETSVVSEPLLEMWLCYTVATTDGETS